MSFYNSNSGLYVFQTLGLDMSDVYKPFLQHIPSGGRILDAGCGSARDARQFKMLGYCVNAFDASEEMAESAFKETGIKPEVMLFQDFDSMLMYHGIWACASLIHVPREELVDAVQRLINATLHGGVIYMSFKRGKDHTDSSGREFTCFTTLEALQFIGEFSDVDFVEMWVTESKKSLGDEWINIIVKRKGVETC